MRLLRKKYRNYSDESLMEEISLNNAAAFEELYDRYAKPLMNYFFRMIQHDKEKAEDFTQDLFTKIIQNPHLFDPTRSFKTWVYSIANNMCKNEYKKLAVRSQVQSEGHLPEQINHHERSAVEITDNNDFSKALQEALGKLDEKHREIFVLRYFDELSVKEIAEIVDIKEGTVKSRIFYAIKKLASDLSHFQVALIKD